MVLHDCELALEEAGFTFIEVLFAELHPEHVPLVDVDRKDDAAGGDAAGAMVQKLGVVQLELADLVAHVVDSAVEIVVEHAQEALHALDGSREVVVEIHVN